MVLTGPSTSPRRDPRDPNLPELAPWQRAPGIRDMRDIDYGLALYRAEITYLDAQLAQLINHSRMKRAITACEAGKQNSVVYEPVRQGIGKGQERYCSQHGQRDSYSLEPALFGWVFVFHGAWTVHRAILSVKTSL